MSLLDLVRPLEQLAQRPVQPIVWTPAGPPGIWLIDGRRLVAGQWHTAVTLAHRVVDAFNYGLDPVPYPLTQAAACSTLRVFGRWCERNAPLLIAAVWEHLHTDGGYLVYRPKPYTPQTITRICTSSGHEGSHAVTLKKRDLH